MTSGEAAAVQFDAWHPGVESRIPRGIRHLATIYRPENVYTAVTQAEELQDLTGLPRASSWRSGPSVSRCTSCWSG
jgi:hypothetical protein